MSTLQERRFLGRMIWRELLREQQPNITKEEIVALWKTERPYYVKLAGGILRRAEKRGHKIEIGNMEEAASSEAAA